MKILFAVILFPLVIVFALLVLVTAFAAWIFGAPLTLTFPGGRKEVYRWFTRIK